MTLAAAPARVGRLLALHIMTVLRTSRGVVAAAAAAPAAPPIMRSSSTVGCTCRHQQLLLANAKHIVPTVW